MNYEAFSLPSLVCPDTLMAYQTHEPSPWIKLTQPQWLNVEADSPHAVSYYDCHITDKNKTKKEICQTHTRLPRTNFTLYIFQTVLFRLGVHAALGFIIAVHGHRKIVLNKLMRNRRSLFLSCFRPVDVSTAEGLHDFSNWLRHQFSQAYILLWLSVITVIKHERHFGPCTRSLFDFKTKFQSSTRMHSQIWALVLLSAK